MNKNDKLSIAERREVDKKKVAVDKEINRVIDKTVEEALKKSKIPYKKVK